jgi:glycosyltransferase involved in cell wall biosynthesis
MGVKIAFDESWYGISGVGRYSYELAQRLKKAPNFEVRGFKRIHPASPFAPITLAFELQKFGDSDIFWSPQYMMPVFAKQRVAITVHDLLQFHYSSKAKAIYFRHVLRNLYRRADKIITVSQAIKDELSNWLGCSNEIIKVVGNGLSEEFTRVGKKFTLDAPYFLYIGNRRPHKNLKRMIEAFSRSQAHRHSVLAVSGNDDPELRAMASRYGVQDRIRVLGFPNNDELAKIYRGAVATLYVSIYEGFGLPIIESMASGTPVIVTKFGATAETAGSAALLVNPFDVDEIADAIDKAFLQGSDYLDLVEAGINRSQLYSWQNSFEQLSSVLSELA